jgi:L-asparaginase II
VQRGGSEEQQEAARVRQYAEIVAEKETAAASVATAKALLERIEAARRRTEITIEPCSADHGGLTCTCKHYNNCHIHTYLINMRCTI